MHALADRVAPHLSELLDVGATAYGSGLKGNHVVLVLGRVTACSGVRSGLDDAEGGEGGGVIVVGGGGVIDSGCVKTVGGIGRDGFWCFRSVRDVSGVGGASGEVQSVQLVVGEEQGVGLGMVRVEVDDVCAGEVAR